MKKHIDVIKENKYLFWVSLGWLFISVLFYELLFSILLHFQFGFYTAGFSLSTALFCTGIAFISKSNKVRIAILGFVTVFLSLIYIAQLIYFRMFGTLFIVDSLSLAGGALTFTDIAMGEIGANLIPMFFYFIPSVAFFVFVRKAVKHVPSDWSISVYCLLLFFIVGAVTTITVLLDKKDALSARRIYLSEFVHERAMQKFGLLTATGLDIRYNVFGIRFEDDTPVDLGNVKVVDAFATKDSTATAETDSSAGAGETQPEDVDYGPNIMDIQFNMEEEDSDLYEMNVFFSNREPTYKNKYTGMFAGKNLILITAEAFSTYVIDPELTPTLYKLSTEGFVFNNFYTPIWNVSTASGEYVANTGLLPDLGTTKYTVIGDRYMPFAFGNQFSKIGYVTKAYHNHTYTYYSRDKTYPPMGYVYKGKGSGLDVKDTWPESDLEMIKLSAPEFVNDVPFHVYYLTVSGHCNYNFYGNYIAAKNKEKVAHMDKSETIRAYYASQLELEYAMTELLAELEAAGQLENTVIALSADHYPYALVEDANSYQYINELAGKELEKTFELYKNSFLLWSGDMTEPIVVDKYCSSLDIAPTLSNLFGLEYDSRLYIGTDILSTSTPYVIFKDYSFINDKIMYNMNGKTVTRLVDEEISDTYLEVSTSYVKSLFKYSRMIYQKDYYAYLFNQ